MSNVLAGTKEQVKQVFEANLIPHITRLCVNDEFDVMKVMSEIRSGRPAAAGGCHHGCSSELLARSSQMFLPVCLSVRNEITIDSNLKSAVGFLKTRENSNQKVVAETVKCETLGLPQKIKTGTSH